MSIDALYNTRATVIRLTHVDSVFGKDADTTETNHILDMPCRIEPLSAREIERFEKTTGVVSHRLFCASGRDIKADDKIAEGSTEYRVAGPALKMAGASAVHHQEIPLVFWEES